MEAIQQQQSTQARTTPTQNQRAMKYLQGQVDLYLSDKSSFFHGQIVGGAQALCMAGVITAEQWRQIEDQTW